MKGVRDGVGCVALWERVTPKWAFELVRDEDLEFAVSFLKTHGTGDWSAMLAFGHYWVQVKHYG